MCPADSLCLVLYLVPRPLLAIAPEHFPLYRNDDYAACIKRFVPFACVVSS